MRTPPRESSEKHTAGALDIRNIIGGLLACYGVILVLMGIFDDYDPEKTGDVNANLWAGLAMASWWARVHGVGPAPADRGARGRRDQHDGPTRS